MDARDAEDRRWRSTWRRFTRTEYHRMAEVGILRRRDRVELIRGEIVEMTPIGRRHGAFVDRDAAAEDGCS